MKVQYAADDGQVFNTRAECQSHEKQLRLANFGTDTRFIQAVLFALHDLESADNRDNPIIHFDDAGKVDVAKAIAKNFKLFQDALESILRDAAPKAKLRKIAAPKRPYNDADDEDYDDDE
jgi:hypothetical protein